MSQSPPRPRSPSTPPGIRNAFQDRNQTKKGREYQDPRKAERFQNASGSVIHTLPDITTATRIVAVCGVVDDNVANTAEGSSSGRAAPENDGWFVSDFYAFKHILKDAGSSQKWITCEPPSELVKRYGSYLHGSPFYDRKVVLSETEVLKTSFLRDVVQSPKNILRETFMKHLKEEADTARKNNQPLVLFVFAHGDYHDDFGMQLGATSGRADQFSIADFKSVVEPGTTVTICTTACYSGGWAIYNDFSMELNEKVYKEVGQKLNASLMTAAGPMSTSESYGASLSIGRFCGSFWASALMSAFRDESEKAAAVASSSPLSSALSAEEGSLMRATYYAFTEQVYDTLMQMERKAEVHQIRFAAQDDDWLSAWGPRTGIPLIDFKKNWDLLETVAPTQDPNNSANRGRPLKSDEQETATPGRSGSSRGRPGTINFKANFLKRECALYLSSFPGADNVPNNTTFHSTIKGFISGKYPSTDPVNQELIEKMILFRNNLAKLATCLLDLAKIPQPNGANCSHFDQASFETGLPEEVMIKYHSAWKMVRSGTLPRPAQDESQGRVWEKPNWYIAAAIALDDSVKNGQDIAAAVERIKTCYKTNYLEDIKTQLDRTPSLMLKKQAWYSSLRKRLRSLSPDKHGKRQSIGGGSSVLGTIPALVYKGKGKAPEDRSSSS